MQQSTGLKLFLVEVGIQQENSGNIRARELGSKYMSLILLKIIFCGGIFLWTDLSLTSLSLL